MDQKTAEMLKKKSRGRCFIQNFMVGEAWQLCVVAKGVTKVYSNHKIKYTLELSLSLFYR